MRSLLFLILILIIFTGCKSADRKPPVVNPWDVKPPAETSVELVDEFTPEETPLIHGAIDFILAAWDEKQRSDPGFLPGVGRLHVLIQIKRGIFPCGDAEVAGGCSYPWEGRIEVSAGWVMEVPILIHELCHYHLPYPFDHEHTHPMWDVWDTWAMEIRDQLFASRR